MLPIHEPASSLGILPSISNTGSSTWYGERQEGKLAVDVIELEQEVIIISTIAGALDDSFDLSIQDDLLTIRGVREHPLQTISGEVLHQECFWGPFSRTIVLPVEVKNDLAVAEYKQGILTIHIPKQRRDRRIPITVVDD